MDVEKHNRITAALTINAILLVFILIAVVIAQIIEIVVKKSYLDDLNNEKYRLEQELRGKEDNLERLQTDEEYLDTIIKLAQLGVMPD